MEDGIDLDKELELILMDMSEEILLILFGIELVKFVYEIVSFWRYNKEERFDGNGSCKDID